MSFNDFSLQPATRAALASMNIIEPTPVQAEAIPALMAGRDLVGQSATGSGKTLAYGIPLVERVSKNKREVQALVLVPTRELALQVNSVLSKLAVNRRITTAVLVGGRPYGGQISALRYGSQIVVGTPGRVKDHLDRGTLVLDQLKICILDEADQMLDSGFAPDIEEILTTTPDIRQMALFSATMPDWIVKLEKKFLKDPVRVAISTFIGGESTIEQIAYQVPQAQKMAALCTLLNSTSGESSLIFGKTKYGVEKLGKQLNKLGYTVGTLHGNKSQRAREEVLTAFRQGRVQTLLATNVAARGLDIQGIHQVINYELPESSDLFTHRIGRTGRMGRQGRAITLLAPADMPKWRHMARNLGQVVSLQKLAIDENAAVEPVAPIVAVAAAPITHEIIELPEYEREQRPTRERQQPSRDQERSKRERPAARERETFSREAERDRRERPERNATRDTKRREKNYSERAVWDLERAPRSDSPRSNGKKAAASRSVYGRTAGKRRDYASAAPQSRFNRRKLRATS
jgi:ATP-dependent RNA helicase DeaD